MSIANTEDIEGKFLACNWNVLQVKDGNNVDLAVEAKTQATVTFKDGSTALYNVYVVRNAAQYAATTCTMKFA